MNNLPSQGISASVEPRDMVRQRLRSGALPRGPGARVFGGRGSGGHCSCCDLPIPAGEIEFEVEVTAARAPPQILLMHSHCLRIWYDEWTEELESP